MKSVIYKIDGGEQQVHLCQLVLTFLDSFKQFKSTQNESGGQLFAKLSGEGDVLICHATGPGEGDKASLFSFVINKFRGNREIKKLFRAGFHYVGDWHTHPEEIPKASDTDISSMSDLYKRSKHQHESFIMLILGTAPGASGIWLSQHRESDYKQLLIVGEGDHICEDSLNLRKAKV